MVFVAAFFRRYTVRVVRSVMAKISRRFANRLWLDFSDFQEICADIMQKVFRQLRPHWNSFRFKVLQKGSGKQRES